MISAPGRLWPISLVMGMCAAVLLVAPGTAAQPDPPIVVVGGQNAVSGQVAGQLASCTDTGVSRIAGANRYETSRAISATYFSPGVPVAYIATGENHSDALAAGPAAAITGGPVLLTRGSALSAPTRSELDRLEADRVVILGGTNAISSAVENQVRSLTGAPVERLAGTDRYGTAAAISAMMFDGKVDTVYVAGGETFPDALTAGPLAAADHAPILLVARNHVPAVTHVELARLDPERIVIVGGSSVVSDTVASQLEGSTGASVSRIAGANRYATAAAASATLPTPATIFVATGLDFPDALAGSTVATRQGGILLVRSDNIPAATLQELSRIMSGQCAATLPLPAVGTVKFTAAGDIGGLDHLVGPVLSSMSSRSPDFWLLLGDHSYREITPESAWCDWVTGYFPEAFPIEVVAGNHEDDARADGFIRDFTPCVPDRMGATGDYGVEYYFDRGPVRVIMVAAALAIDGVTYDYDRAGPRRDWLLARVDEAEAAGRWTIIGMHKNCITAGAKSCEIGESMIDDLIAHGADVILQGHDHNFQRSHQLSCIDVNTTNIDCIADTDSQFRAEAGAVIVVSGWVGRSGYDVSALDSEAGYFATIGGTNIRGWSRGYLTVDATEDLLEGTWTSVVDDNTDTFTIRR